MFRIGICDDESNARDALRFELEKAAKEEDWEIVYEFSSGTVALSCLKNHPGEIDLLFLDVEMPGMSGMETARRIRVFSRELLLVFVTGYSDYVFDGYQVGAMDYLIKPVDQRRLESLLHRAQEILGVQEDRMFSFRNAEGMFRMPIKEIRYFYSDRRKVSLVLEDREYSFYGKLNQIEQQVGTDYVRIHQRYLVNPRWVEHIGCSTVTVEGKELPVSRGFKENAMEKLARAMLKGGY